MKQLEMSALEPGDSHIIRASHEAEIVRRAVNHLRRLRGEDAVGPQTVEAIKARIQDAA
ncbi:MAG: DUF1059 domain-containing protein [Pseudomonadota bacterium]